MSNINNIWYNRLYSVTLNLICQYAIISIDCTPPIANIFCVPLCNILRVIPTFKGGFQDLTIKCKFMVLMADIEMQLSRINLDVYEYNLDSNAELPAALDSAISLSPSTPPLSARTYTVFIDGAINTKSTSETAAKEQKKAILQ